MGDVGMVRERERERERERKKKEREYASINRSPPIKFDFSTQEFIASVLLLLMD